MTPLTMILSRSSHFPPGKIVDILLVNGARPELPDYEGKTALHWVIEQRPDRGVSIELVRKLLENDAVGVNAKEKVYGNTYTTED